MFENSGEKIKKIAIISFWIVVIASIILACVLGWTEEYSYYGRRYNAFHAEYFFPIIIGGPLSAYISSLFLVGFGDLVENIQTIANSCKNASENSEE